MIERPKNLVTKKVNFLFNKLEIHFLELDLKHINKGKGSSRDENYTGDQLEAIISLILDGRSMEVVAEKQYGVYLCKYYVLEEMFYEKCYRIVLCFCDDRPNTLGVITFFRLRGKNE